MTTLTLLGVGCQHQAAGAVKRKGHVGIQVAISRVAGRFIAAARPRRKWENDAGNQTVTPLRLCWPSTLADVVEAVKDAERLNLNVRGVGSGHSWSDAAISRT
jgi:FAD/FMN-containing dehydrogenase